MRRLLKLFLVAACATAVGCANPSVVRVKEDQIDRGAITKVYVPRFEGAPNFVEASTDLFVVELESRLSAQVVQGGPLRFESTDVHSGANLAPVELAIAPARAAGAQFVIMGKVTSHHTGATINGFSTVRVVDVGTGSVVASFHRPSGRLVVNSEHQAVMSAVSRTARDVAEALR